MSVERELNLLLDDDDGGGGKNKLMMISPLAIVDRLGIDVMMLCKELHYVCIKYI